MKAPSVTRTLLGGKGSRAGVQGQAGRRRSLRPPRPLSREVWGGGLWAAAGGRAADRNVSPLHLGLCALQFSTDTCYQRKPKGLKSQETGSLSCGDASTAFAGHAHRKPRDSDTVRWVGTPALGRDGPDQLTYLTRVPELGTELM